MLPDGEVLRIHPKWRSLSWNLTEYRAFKNAVSPGAQALDVGANLGAYSLLISQWVGPSGHVHAFEPNPQVSAGLERHVSMNHLEDRVTIVRKAVSDREMNCFFTFGDSIGSGRLEDRAAPHSREDRVLVESISLDGFCRQRGILPQFVKIDVEGAEFEVLRGARDLMRSLGRSLRCFVELHPSIWIGQGRGKKDWSALLDELSLAMVMIAPGFDPWHEEGVCVELVPKSSAAASETAVPGEITDRQ